MQEQLKASLSTHLERGRAKEGVQRCSAVDMAMRLVSVVPAPAPKRIDHAANEGHQRTPIRRGEQQVATWPQDVPDLFEQCALLVQVEVLEHLTGGDDIDVIGAEWLRERVQTDEVGREDALPRGAHALFVHVDPGDAKSMLDEERRYLPCSTTDVHSPSGTEREHLADECEAP